MKKLVFLLFLFYGFLTFSQEQQKQSTIDFVEVLNGNYEEALFYYENNWKELRKTAVGKGYIDSYQLLEISFSVEEPFHFILITTYSNKEQFENRERNFSKIIESQNGLKLLNDKKPNDFRKTVMGSDRVKHLE